jgi:prepilin-type N-terminal cleavage/methylation domain-containing protein
MNKKNAAFTLIEVLITILLLALIVPALFKTITLLQHSNNRMEHYLEEVENDNRIYRALFEDIAASDGNITLRSGDFDALCVKHTRHTLYTLGMPSVCWVVSREEKRLVRIEGETLRYFPLRLRESDSDVYADVFFEVESFVIERKKENVFVMVKKKAGKAVAFIVQGVYEPIVKKNKKPKRKKSGKRTSSAQKTKNRTQNAKKSNR